MRLVERRRRCLQTGVFSAPSPNADTVRQTDEVDSMTRAVAAVFRNGDKKPL
jgi:hypothetical protein